MTIAIDLTGIGHDGRCDTCGLPADVIVLSASVPEMWSSGSPAASLACLCAICVGDEPVAYREHAEHVARHIGGDAAVIWDALLAQYPSPLSIVRAY